MTTLAYTYAHKEILPHKEDDKGGKLHSGIYEAVVQYKMNVISEHKSAFVYNVTSIIISSSLQDTTIHNLTGMTNSLA